MEQSFLGGRELNTRDTIAIMHVPVEWHSHATVTHVCMRHLQNPHVTCGTSGISGGSWLRQSEAGQQPQEADLLAGVSGRWSCSTPATGTGVSWVGAGVPGASRPRAGDHSSWL